jgi:hypothetical protein
MAKSLLAGGKIEASHPHKAIIVHHHILMVLKTVVPVSQRIGVVQSPTFNIRCPKLGFLDGTHGF